MPFKAVNCLDCGDNLGYQDAQQPINRRYWEHHYCAPRIARRWGISSSDAAAIHDVICRAIAGAYPDITGTLGDPADKPKIQARARIAANHVMAALEKEHKVTPHGQP